MAAFLFRTPFQYPPLASNIGPAHSTHRLQHSNPCESDVLGTDGITTPVLAS